MHKAVGTDNRPYCKMLSLLSLESVRRIQPVLPSCEKLGPFLNQARALMAEGKGEEKVRLGDYEGSRGVYPVVVAPRIYLSWFDPEGPLHELAAVQRMNPATPVLFIVPTGDYQALLQVKQKMFDALPKHPLTRLYEPDSSHIEAPSVSVKAIAEWIASVTAASNPAK